MEGAHVQRLKEHQKVQELSQQEEQVSREQHNAVHHLEIINRVLHVTLEMLLVRKVHLKEHQEAQVSVQARAELHKGHQAVRARTAKAQEPVADRKFRFLVG